MSITLQQCEELLSSSPVAMRGTGTATSADPQAAGACQVILNELTNAGVPWTDVLSKAFTIVAIIGGNGTWFEKATAIFALFSKTPSPTINVPK